MGNADPRRAPDIPATWVDLDDDFELIEAVSEAGTVNYWLLAREPNGPSGCACPACVPHEQIQTPEQRDVAARAELEQLTRLAAAGDLTTAGLARAFRTVRASRTYGSRTLEAARTAALDALASRLAGTAAPRLCGAPTTTGAPCRRVIVAGRRACAQHDHDRHAPTLPGREQEQVSR